MTDSASPAEERPLTLREAVRHALNELGVPGEGYPSPVANAVDILSAALASVTDDDPTTRPGYYCTECPHGMHLHEDDGSCGGGCH